MNFLKHLLPIFLVLSGGALTAQSTGHIPENNMDEPCSQMHMTHQLFEQHPELVPGAKQAEAELEAFTENFEIPESKSGENIIIPVVFHVVHLNGPENISDEQVQSAVDVLNEDFSATNPEIGNVVEEFVDIIADVGVEFRLARTDPWGNCTNGINRVYSAETLDGSATSLKQAVPSWGRSKYLNIWVVRNIPGSVVGFSYLPPSVNGGGFGAQIDGVVMQSNFLGRTGTSSPSQGHTLTHEVGHWLNLMHTWGPGEVGHAGNCGASDHVADTPPTIGWQTCNLDAATCGGPDNVQNFMDYSFCYAMFTEGQKMRMLAALNSSVAQRSNLHSQANLIQTGVLDEDEICEVDFSTASPPELCAGGSLQFIDHTFHNPTQWNWTFEGGSPSVSQSPNPTVTYNQPGTYSVTLTAGTDLNEETTTKVGYVTVLPAGMEDIPYTENFQEVPDLDGSTGWIDINPNNDDISWELNQEVGYTDNASVYVRGRLNENGAVEVLVSPSYDLSALEQMPVITFKYAHRRRSNLTNDQLRVFISADCGATWVLRNELSGNGLSTVPGYEFTSFEPNSDDQWAEAQIPFVVSSFHTDQFRMKFEFISHEGNNFYLDDINISGVTSATNTPGLDDLSLYPNPTGSDATLELSLNRSTPLDIDLLDITGRTVKNVWSERQSSGVQRITIPTGGLAAGMYALRIRTDQGVVTERLIVE